MMKIGVGVLSSLLLLGCGGASSTPDGGASGTGDGGTVGVTGQSWYRSCDQIDSSGQHECKEETTHDVSSMFAPQIDKIAMDEINSCNLTKGTGWGGSTTQRCATDVPGCVCSWPIMQGAPPPYGLTDTKYFHYMPSNLTPAQWLSLFSPVKNQCLHTLAGAWTCFGGIDDGSGSGADGGSPDGGSDGPQSGGSDAGTSGGAGDAAPTGGPVAGTCTVTFSGAITGTMDCMAFLTANPVFPGANYLVVQAAGFNFQIDGTTAVTVGIYSNSMLPSTLVASGMAMNGVGVWKLKVGEKALPPLGQFLLDLGAIDGGAPASHQPVRATLDATYAPVAGTGNLTVHVAAM